MTDIRDINEIIRSKKINNIYIYGAGTIANLAFILMKESGLDHLIKGFIVSDMKWNPHTKNGRQVVCLDDISKSVKGTNSIILIAVNDSVREDIEKRLIEDDISNYCMLNEEIIKEEIYDILYHQPISRNKIVFMADGGRRFGDNPKYITNELLKRDANNKLDIVWAFRSKKTDLPKGIRQVCYESLEYYREIATARIWVDNNRKSADIKKRKGQLYIQTWHGAAPIKRVESDVIHSLTPTYVSNAKKDSAMADLFISGSRFYSELYRRAFWYDGEILEKGLPRQDVFWNSDIVKHNIRKQFNIPDGVSIVLYAPTFRNSLSPDVYDLDLINIKKALKKRFGSEFVFLVSKHPSNQERLKYPFEDLEDYVDVSDYDDFEEILAAADVLITDYSGCMYDFSHKKQPIFLYQKDYEEYLMERDFYIPINELPYISAYSNEELCDKIRDFDEDMYKKRLEVFMRSMGNFDDGKASEKVADWICGKLEL